MKSWVRHHLNYYRFGRQFQQHPAARRATERQRSELSKPGSRTEMINLVINIFKRPVTYLEIGVRNPEDNFDHIGASTKYGVDPGEEYQPNPVAFPLTSDAFFAALRAGEILSPHIRFDVVFIDGLHLAEQVDRDIVNTLDFLTEDGFVMLHDCNPPSIFHAREDYAYRHTPVRGSWTGTTWKAFVKWRARPDLYSCCIDTDYGVGVLSRALGFGTGRPEIRNDFYEYRVLEQHRQDQLGLISPERFTTLLEGPTNRLGTG